MPTQTLAEDLQLELIGDDERGYDFITPEDIQLLKELSAEPGVFSLYLDTTAERMQSEPLALRYKKLVEERRQHVVGRESRLLFDAVAEHIGKLLESSYGRPRGRGLALFAIPERFSPKGGPEVKYRRLIRYHLPEPPLDALEWGETPLLTPLLIQLDEHAPTGVVVVDRKHARFFVYYMGEAAEYGVSEIGETPPRTRSLGWGAHNHEQWQETHYQKHLQQVAELTARLDRVARWKWLTIGGVDQAPQELKERLPKPLQQKFLGHFNIHLTATLNEVRDEVGPLVHAAEVREESDTLAAWVGALKTPGGRAVAGLADTTLAAQQARIQTLIIPPNWVQPGWQCQSCQGLMADILAEPPKACIYCGAPLKALPDIISVAAAQTLTLGGQVEIVRDPENQAILKQYGEIGALLRY
ncbi:MAG: hypothetical protein GXP42_03075 [Chloroflexi bacterium]|nr:hypothetical protein [Chloroflexota bacterium]